MYLLIKYVLIFKLKENNNNKQLLYYVKKYYQIIKYYNKFKNKNLKKKK